MTYSKPGIKNLPNQYLLNISGNYPDGIQTVPHSEDLDVFDKLIVETHLNPYLNKRFDYPNIMRTKLSNKCADLSFVYYNLRGRLIT